MASTDTKEPSGRPRRERIDDKIFTAATVVYVLFLPLYPITANLMGEATSNTVIAVATVVNVLVTAVYAFFTWHLWRQTRVAADAAREEQPGQRRGRPAAAHLPGGLDAG